MWHSFTSSIQIPNVSQIAEWWKARRLLQLWLEMFQDSDPHSRVFSSWATSLLLKKCFKFPICDLAFFVRASISVSSVRQGVIIEPRYLNLLVKWMSFFPSLSLKEGWSSIWFIARRREGGMHIASVFDFALFVPTCTWRPNLEKWLCMVLEAFF